jgi:prephenate dehydrogenase
MAEKIFKGLGLKVVKTTPEQHDREAARSLALVHFIGRGLDRLKLKPQPVTTLGYERLLKVNETVTNDTWQLFRDMHRYNPYAKKARQKLLKALAGLDKSL